jgi:predicted sulfurtransferase
MTAEEEEEEEDRDDYRIALYYSYVPIENVNDCISLQHELCTTLNLMGRIRVSREGMNGVLSGLYRDLLVYQQSIDVELDIKYCQLRSDLPTALQLFTSLSIKATREVVSLYEPPAGVPQQPQAKWRQTRRKRQEQQKEEGNDDLPTKVGLENKKDRRAQWMPFSPNDNKQDLLSNQYEPAPHLSPEEWNQLLLEDPENTILLDARNVYESRVGHFSVEGIPTLLTNTRKYSNLPQVLEAFRDELVGKRVFMYCTGGVRCERASAYLQALLIADDSRPGDDDDDTTGGVKKERAASQQTKIYQLHGGIQRYLEVYGNHNGQKGEDCLYRGKNFVFDPRRTDFVTGRAESCTGTCLLCSKPHDDYDNGYAPCQDKAARCNKCRVLVLVCNACRRSKVTVWGERPSKPQKPNLYCGGSQCIDQGNTIQATII